MPVPGFIQRQFTAARLDVKWCGGITCVQVGGAWLYLACVIDSCSRGVSALLDGNPHTR